MKGTLMPKMTLTAKKVQRLLKRPGRYRDDGVRGLLLVVRNAVSASWTLRYEKDGREHWLGLGSVRDFTLKEARERARAARQMLADGVDPREAKRSTKAARALEAAKAMTFEAAATAYFDGHQKRWGRKSREQFLSSLKQFCFPIIGSLSVAAIDVGLVLKVLEQPYAKGRFWDTRTVTAGRVRGRIESVLDWAAVRGYRTGDNPARWRGHLQEVLPARNKLQRRHFDALPYAEVPAFMEKLRAVAGVPARALEFTILTAARSGETRFAVWSEFDLQAATWTVPAARMKAHREHRQPLASRVIELLRALPTIKGSDAVFIGGAGGALGSGAMAAVLKQLNSAVTIHGFRSSFRDWSAERTNYPREVCELALAHNIGSAVEKAYMRSDLIAQRRKLMEAWAAYCAVSAAETGAVIPLKANNKQTKIAAT
jgi:integrase